MMFVDLHIHSCLSACADNDMTPNNIVNMAKLKGLDLIAVTDHNSAKNQPAIDAVAKRVGLSVLYGVEVCSYEEVHVLVYFRELNQVMQFDEWLCEHYLPMRNHREFYGDQLMMNDQDEVMAHFLPNLSIAITQSIASIVKVAKRYQGACVYAHALHKRNGIIQQLGLIMPDDLIDGLEVIYEEDKTKLIEDFPYLQDKVWLRNSDAHQLQDILERSSHLSQKKLKQLFGSVS
jgi:3',5'-nucleoside bisphosphate phosphatase